ncbi:MAG: hypothetical protein AAGF81_22765, partial [Pseudomonadota bacterium]
AEATFTKRAFIGEDPFLQSSLEQTWCPLCQMSANGQHQRQIQCGNQMSLDRIFVICASERQPII